MSDKKIVEEHLQKHTITEYLHMPEHDERKETLEFRNAKHELEVVEHLGCYKCGTMKKRQSHHIFERCWGNAYDFVKVSYFLYNHFDFHGHVKRDFKSEQELLDWFVKHFNGQKFEYVVEHEQEDGTVKTENKIGYHCDDDALDTLYNQWILCESDHIGKATGIHMETAPTFFGSLAMEHGFLNALTEEQYNEMKKKLADSHKS